MVVKARIVAVAIVVGAGTPPGNDTMSLRHAGGVHAAGLVTLTVT